MIAWSIETAIASSCFERVIVSTDDQEIAKVAESFGAEVPFIRPDELADDFTGTSEVIAHAVQWLGQESISVEFVCCMYPASPFIQSGDVLQGLERMKAEDWEYCFTATKFTSSVFRSFQQSRDGGLEMFFPDHFRSRSQDLPEALHDAAQFYWGRPAAWIQLLPIFDRYSCPLVLPHWRVQDIDTEEDWIRAELLATTLMGAGYD